MTRLLFTGLLLLQACFAAAQAPKAVKLKATAGKVTLQHCTVTLVADDRSDTSNIGMMRAGLRNKPAPVVLSGGTRSAIAGFIRDYVLQESDNDAIELHILQLQVSEKAIGSKEQADLNTQFGFFRKGQKIIDYSSTAYVQSGLDASPYIGRLVSQSLEHVLKEFDQWWGAHKASYDDSGKDKITVTVQLRRRPMRQDQLVFDRAIPLQVSDFGGKPDKLSRALAATVSGFSLQYELRTAVDGTRAAIQVLPYFDRSKSWMKPSGDTSRILAHEQQHFNIAALKTYAFVNALKVFPFTAAGFDNEVNALQDKYLKALDEMQAQYDEETRHGTLRGKQKEWEARIQTELDELSAGG